MSADLPPIPPELAALIGDESSAPAGSDADRARIGARIAGSVGLVSSLGSGGAAAAATTATTATTTGSLVGVAGKVVAIVIALGTVGGGVAYVATRGHAPQAPASASAPSPAAPRSHVTAVPLPPAPDVELDPAPPAPEPAPPKHPAAPATPSAAPVAVESEPALLARAWSARYRGDAQLVLALVERDATLHADGQLAEERDALRVDALAQLGRNAEARAAARAFLARYPHSLQRALVAHVLEESP